MYGRISVSEVLGHVRGVNRRGFLPVFVMLLMAGPVLAQMAGGVAVANKVRGSSQIKRAGTTEYRSELRRGTALRDQDWLKTMEDGYIAIIFIDDKSQMKIRGNSEVEISTSRQAGGLAKTISMNFGKMKVEVEPLTGGSFTIATPTSVASVKGTEFWIISDPEEGDQFIVTEGDVEVTNSESGETVTVSEGETGTSTPEGDVDVEETPEGGVPEEEEDMDELRIELENDEGDIKAIIIRY